MHEVETTTGEKVMVEKGYEGTKLVLIAEDGTKYVPQLDGDKVELIDPDAVDPETGAGGETEEIGQPEEPEAEGLAALTIAELEDIADGLGVNLPSHAHKDEWIAAIEAARAASQGDEETTEGGDPETAEQEPEASED